MSAEGPQRTYLFTDLRHIRCGDLSWVSPSGEALPVAGPPEPPVEARAVMGMVPYGVRLVAQPGSKTEPLEVGQPRGSRVVYDGGVYRSWSLRPEYPAGQNLGAYSTAGARSVAIAYTESPDGFVWAEKARSAFETPGATGFDGFTVFVDPSGPPEERYKAVFMAEPPEDRRAELWQRLTRIHPRYRDERLRESYVPCLYGAVSPDGLNWQGLPEPLMVHKSDTDTSVYYDEWLGRYVMYTRLYPFERRTIGRAETEDFRRWEGVEPLIWPTLDDPLSDDLYTNGYSQYPGGPMYHLMFPMVYHRYTQTSDVLLYSSPDGLRWDRVPGGPVLSAGAPGEWDSEFIHAGKDLVPFGADRVAVPYGGTSYPHKYPRWKHFLDASRGGWAWWPKGRLVAVQADNWGEFWTFPIPVAGRELRANLRTSRAGEVRIGLAGIEGHSGDDVAPLVGDHLAAPVHWRGETNLGVPEGQSVTLHFRLRAAEVFGFEWV